MDQLSGKSLEVQQCVVYLFDTSFRAIVPKSDLDKVSRMLMDVRCHLNLNSNDKGTIAIAREPDLVQKT